VITVATTTILKELHKSGGKQIHFVGIDDDKLVLDAIRNGEIDATMRKILMVMDISPVRS